MYVTQLRDRYKEISETGTGLVAIGMGRPDMAAHFREEFDIPFRLLVDQQRQTYPLLDIKRGTWWDVAGPHMWADFAKRLLRGQVTQGVKGDPLQMGGLAVIEPGGHISKVHKSEDPKDNLSIDQLLKELR